MKIAQIAPLAERCPPRMYGGTERIVSYLTEELVRQGHDVTLFASGDSKTAAKLVRCSDMALRLNPAVTDPIPYHITMLDEVRRRADAFDVLHFHIDLLHYPIVRDFADRIVTTLHGRLDLPDLKPFYAAFPELPLVSISHDQRRPLPCHLNWVGNVQHGLPRDLLPFTPEPKDDYLAFLGRISPEKRPDRAIAIAAQAGMKLKIAAKIDKADQAYWDETIAPLIASHPNVEFIGEIDEQRKADFLGHARALLFPIDWPEPFGLVMIEAMACGTPIIAFASGSVPEVIDDGVTGFIVASIPDAVAAIARLSELDRRKVRATFETRFTVERMARDYAEIYTSLAEVPIETAGVNRAKADARLQALANGGRRSAIERPMLSKALGVFPSNQRARGSRQTEGAMPFSSLAEPIDLACGEAALEKAWVEPKTSLPAGVGEPLRTNLADKVASLVPLALDEDVRAQHAVVRYRETASARDIGKAPSIRLNRIRQPT